LSLTEDEKFKTSHVVTTVFESFSIFDFFRIKIFESSIKANFNLRIKMEILQGLSDLKKN